MIRSLFLIFLCTAPLIAAEDRCLTCGNKGRDSYATLYDVESVETLRGTIVSVEQMTGGSGGAYGMHVTLQTQDGEQISVHLGPTWFLQHQRITVEEGAPILVTGSKVMLDGKPALIAQEVRIGNRSTRLRNDEGYPRWSGSRGLSTR